MATWKKSSPKLVQTFDDALPDDPAVERRQMFGYPCAFARGNMFTGLHEERMVVRLPDRKREALLAVRGAKPFEALGRVMREYVVIPPSVLADRRALRLWTKTALAYAVSLPPKRPRVKAAKKKK